MDRRTGPTLVLLLALTYVQFFQAATWGAACRFDLARALARGTVRIDEFHGNTGDKAFLAGHYYSDKGPLPSVLAVPAVVAVDAVRAATGRPVAEAVRLAIAAGSGAFLASGLPAALAAGLFFGMLHTRGLSRRRAAAAAALVFLGTPLFPYATLLQSHALAAALLLIYFRAMFPAGRSPGGRDAALAGAAASAVLATEILAAPALAILAAFSLGRSPRAAPRVALFVLAGAAPGLALLGYYNTAAFGSPLAFGYQFVALPFFQDKMASGLFGIGAPDAVVAARLLAGPYRGLFFAAPVLVAALAGLVVWLRSADRRIEAWAILAVFVSALALNSGYSSWHGGWAVGARHLVFALPLLGLGLGPAIARFPRAVAALGVASVLLMLAATSVQPEVPEEIGNPFAEHLLPRFAAGELSVAEQGFDDLHPARKQPGVPDRWDAFLLGEAAGLRGLAALLPVFAVWAIFGRRLFAK